MFISSTVSINLTGLEDFKDEVTRQLNGAPGPVNKALRLWAVRYRSYAQIRFDAYSKGGGNWKALAASTIKARRKGKQKSSAIQLKESLVRDTKKGGKLVSAGGNFTILRDKGLLFAALTPVFVGAPGAIEEQIPFGYRVGYGGPQKHITEGKKGNATIADIANFHQNGAEPHLPQREIIVAPDTRTVASMAQDMTKALNEVAAK